MVQVHIPSTPRCLYVMIHLNLRALWTRLPRGRWDRQKGRRPIGKLFSGSINSLYWAHPTFNRESLFHGYICPYGLGLSFPSPICSFIGSGKPSPIAFTQLVQERPFTAHLIGGSSLKNQWWNMTVLHFLFHQLGSWVLGGILDSPTLPRQRLNGKSSSTHHQPSQTVWFHLKLRGQRLWGIRYRRWLKGHGERTCVTSIYVCKEWTSRLPLLTLLPTSASLLVTGPMWTSGDPQTTRTYLHSKKAWTVSVEPLPATPKKGAPRWWTDAPAPNSHVLIIMIPMLITPPKINMEHNNGGLENDFPFQIGDF